MTVIILEGMPVVIWIAKGTIKAKSLSGGCIADWTTSRHTPIFCNAVSMAIVCKMYK